MNPTRTDMNHDPGEQRLIETFCQMADAWQRQDWQACVELFAPDGVLHSVMLEPVVGREAILQRLRGLSGSHKKVTLHIRRIGVVAGALVVERTDEVVIDGRRGECPAVGVIEFAGEKIARWRDYYDRAQLLRASGHAPTPAAPSLSTAAL